MKDSFEPAYLKVQRGSTVEWSRCESELELDEASLYHLSNRMHVISFHSINEESQPLRSPTDTFKLRFFETGVFKYQCSIYTRMSGFIEVFDNEIPKPIAKNINKNYKL